MTQFDPEIEELRDKVSCAVVLEQCASPFKLDFKESSRDCLKYRRDDLIIIVNHGGKGWWDPQHEPEGGKGDVFGLVQYLDETKNFGKVLQYLRPLAGLLPDYPKLLGRPDRSWKNRHSIEDQWNCRKAIKTGSNAWKYLRNCRQIPQYVLDAAILADAVREGAYGSAWFVHRDHEGKITHFEMRGPDFRSSSKGGTKTLFRFPGGPEPSRFVLTEAPIDALSIAAIEHIRPDTLYAATGGGMGQGTIEAVKQVLATLCQHPNPLFCSATDADAAGDRYAARHQQHAKDANVPFKRLRPPVDDGDWNDVLKERMLS